MAVPYILAYFALAVPDIRAVCASSTRCCEPASEVLEACRDSNQSGQGVLSAGSGLDHCLLYCLNGQWTKVLRPQLTTAVKSHSYRVRSVTVYQSFFSLYFIVIAFCQLQNKTNIIIIIIIQTEH